MGIEVVYIENSKDGIQCHDPGAGWCNEFLYPKSGIANSFTAPKVCSREVKLAKQLASRISPCHFNNIASLSFPSHSILSCPSKRVKNSFFCFHWSLVIKDVSLYIQEYQRVCKCLRCTKDIWMYIVLPCKHKWNNALR